MMSKKYPEIAGEVTRYYRAGRRKRDQQENDSFSCAGTSLPEPVLLAPVTLGIDPAFAALLGRWSAVAFQFIFPALIGVMFGGLLHGGVKVAAIGIGMMIGFYRALAFAAESEAGNG